MTPTYLFSAALAALAMATVPASAQNLLVNPGFNQGTDNLDGWEGFDQTAQVIDPADFTTASGDGTAVVGGYSEVETSFYQTFGANALPSGTYTFTADISNIEDFGAATAPYIFVKVFTDGDFTQFNLDKFQMPTLEEGTMTLTYEHDTSDIAQFGWSNFSSTAGFTVANPSVELAVIPEPTSLAALGLGGLALMRRRR